MSKKIGRNNPCPCGSGKKYKRCCINNPTILTNSSIPDRKMKNKSLEYIECHFSGSILNTIISLQLIPENHGKNVRIEELAKHLAVNLNNGKNTNIKLFKECLEKDYSCNPMEDIPENLFCENIVFHGGNYTVFPGISSNAVEVFNNLIETIFTTNNNLPEGFIKHVFSGITLLLELGQTLADKLSLKENIEGTDSETKLKHLSEEFDFSIAPHEIGLICKKYGINTNTINDFVLSPKDKKYNYDDPDLNPLLYYPLVIFEKKYYFLLLSGQLSTLNEYILRLSTVYNCNQELVNLYHERKWEEIWRSSDKMNWKLTNIEIPAKATNIDLKEHIFQFDINRLAYVCYSYNNKTYDKYAPREDNESIVDINVRVEEVIISLKADKRFKDFHFLSLILFDHMGRNMFLSFDRPQEKELRLAFSSFQYAQLIATEEWSNLSLWKFAKSYNIFSKSTRTFADTLDLYSIYKSNGDSFYFSDDARSDLVTLTPGEGSHLIKKSKLSRNKHGVLAYIENRLVYIPVYKSRDFAPIYKPVQSLGYYALCLESYSFPMWLANRQIKDRSMMRSVRNFLEAIGFWLHKLQAELEITLNQKINTPIEIEVILDDKIFENNTAVEITVNDDLKEYSCQYKNNKIQFFIPFSLLFSFIGSKNEGERKMMNALLNSFNSIPGINISNVFIEKIIDKVIPFGNAKMILFSDSQTNLLIDDRWLIPQFYISDAEVELLLDKLPELIEENISIPENINSPEEKKELFNIATKVLLNKLKEEISIFDSNLLLNNLIDLNETLVWKREYNKTLVPAQILCFGEKEEKVKEVLEKERKTVQTSLAVRCLVEYLASSPTNGSAEAGLDDIDKLLVIMHEIANYGFLSDAIHFKMADPKVGKLKSGRIGISKEFFEKKLKPFSIANNKEEIDNYLQGFENRFEVFIPDSKPLSEPKIDKELEAIDNAFLNDWKIGFFNIYKFCYSCAVICINSQSSIISINEDELIKQLSNDFKLPNEEVIAGINLFSMSSRPQYLKAPEGFNDNEVFPWKYNREFSFTRRFIVKHYNKEKNNTLLTWGFRNAIACQKQLHSLLLQGRLNNGGKQINKLLGKFREKKGKLYRNEVKNWLKSHKELTVIDYEVDISPKGHLKADKKYGDVDILVFDPNSCIVLSLECKDTNKAKNIHEMKKEMDNYLGREGGKGMIKKHIERDTWLNNNKQKICEFLNFSGEISVKSYMLTSEVLPTSYIKAEVLPMPIIAFPDLKREGIKLLVS